MRIVIKRVEKQVRDPEAREIFWTRRPRREDQPPGIDSARLCFVPQILRGGRTAGLREPEHAAVDAFQKTHPNIENVGCDLEDRVEAAEHETGVGKAYLGTAVRPRYEVALEIAVDEIAIRHR